MQLSPDGLPEFKLGRTLLEDDPRAGWTLETTTDDCCRAVETLVMGDRGLKVLEIAKKVGISYGSILNILHEHLGLSRVCARWVSRLLTHVQVVSRQNMFRAVGSLCSQPRPRFVPNCNW